MIQTIPLAIVALFLLRSVRKPLLGIISSLQVNPTPLIILTGFTGGYLGVIYAIPVIVLLGISAVKLPFSRIGYDPAIYLLSLLISSISGYLISGEAPEIEVLVWSLTKIQTYLMAGDQLAAICMLCLGLVSAVICLIPVANLIAQLVYFGILSISRAQPLTVLMSILIWGLISKLSTGSSFYLNLYLIESCLIVTSLYTVYPINLVSSLLSVSLVWQLSSLEPSQIKPISTKLNHLVQDPDDISDTSSINFRGSPTIGSLQLTGSSI